MCTRMGQGFTTLARFCANQVLVNWGDWTSVQDVWVTTAPGMTPNTAVFENWDRLFVKRVLAVSGTRSHVRAVQSSHAPWLFGI